MDGSLWPFLNGVVVGAGLLFLFLILHERHRLRAREQDADERREAARALDHSSREALVRCMRAENEKRAMRRAAWYPEAPEWLKPLVLTSWQTDTATGRAIPGSETEEVP